MALVCIEANGEQLSQIMKDSNYVNIINKNKNAVIILCQNNTVRILHEGQQKPKGLII